MRVEKLKSMRYFFDELSDMGSKLLLKMTLGLAVILYVIFKQRGYC